jgi:hypothetical protein
MLIANLAESQLSSRKFDSPSRLSQTFFFFFFICITSYYLVFVAQWYTMVCK